ncbi:outer membrane beta-barrel protein [Luteolibacter ambystomatis]|uniref:Outer membrane beta-barrel protein n=1 Tax=Luteolibacter ambystomatis TaxID=2824561 RepID=A0A975IZB2_9BACT|nr:outer membrane beta-barrel protein [Luteolibacter ambystomatis]QUE51107.1 outer membrane beta-barrel protein [Luteolibacter ambystomatis]
MIKKSLALALALTGSAWAGPSSKAPIPPPQEPDLWHWFIGGSAGYLVDFEEPYYTGHIGVDTPWKVGGWDIALFAELGYTDKDQSTSVIDPNVVVAVVRAPLNAELEVMPLTFNVKFERPLTGNLNAYFGAGIGVAFTDFSATAIFSPGPVPSLNVSQDDTVFAAQVFAGLIYNFSPNFEIFGGARWLYVDADNSAPAGLDLEFDSDFSFDLGARFTF